MQVAAGWRGREVCEKMKNKSMSILKMTGAAAALVLMFAQPVLADGSFANGTSVNGVAVGGMSNEEAKAKLEQNYGSYKLTIKERGGKTEEITAAEIGYKVVITNELQAAIDQQAAGAAGAGALTIAMPLSCDQTMLANRIASLNCMSDSVAPTVDAHISAWEEGKDFTIVPEVKGESVDKAKVQTAINAAIASGMTEIDLEALGCYTPIQVTSGDASLKALCAQMNQAKNATITFHIGDATETLSGTEYVSWYTGGENGVITVDRDKAAAYIKALAAKYDTAGTTRTFHTTSGKEVALTGPYGWKIDQTAETDNLVLMAQTGINQEREVQFSQQAASHSDADWGNTYAEVDFGAQHVYMYENGALTWDAPCVTGNVSKNYTTPEGIYSLTYKQADRVLRGAKRADGTYEYESHVDYWMPFNGGIGFHDASWRSKFGGTIYQYSGSHGCINLPVDKAKLLYEKVYKGMPVLCHN